MAFSATLAQRMVNSEAPAAMRPYDPSATTGRVRIAPAIPRYFTIRETRKACISAAVTLM